MKIALMGRTAELLETGRKLVLDGHQINLVVTHQEAPEYTATSSDFQQFARSQGATFLKSPSASELLVALEVSADWDIGVSINYPAIIPGSIINRFSHGILNTHGGDLPRYRGNACQAWAIINGEEKIGLCVHKMEGGKLDSGDIIARDYLAIDHTTKVGSVLDWMALRTPELVLDAVDKLLDNPDFIIERQTEDPKNALRCYPRRPEDGLIDWSKSALDVLRLINASNKPFPGAFCGFEGRKVTIWDAEIVCDEEVFCAAPGQVTKVGNGHVEIACGQGKLRLTSIEVERRSIEPSELITSIRKRFS